MNLRIELKGGAMTASMRGELDHHTAGEMREQIDSTAKKVRPQKLILDFKEVPFMDSSGIGLILGRVRTAALWGGRVTVRGLSPQLRKMAMVLMAKLSARTMVSAQMTVLLQLTAA